MPKLSAFPNLFVFLGLLVFVTALASFRLSAQDGSEQTSPLEITVGIPSTPEDQAFLNGINPPPLVPVLIHLKNVSAQEVIIPGFNKLAVPLTITAKTKWMSTPITTASNSTSDLQIAPGETVIGLRDMDSLTSFALFGTYPIPYTFHADYTFYHVKPTDAPGSYVTHPIDISGSFDLPISVNQSTYGWYALIGPISLFVVLIGIVIFQNLTRVPTPKTSWTADFNVGDH